MYQFRRGQFKRNYNQKSARLAHAVMPMKKLDMAALQAAYVGK